MVTGTAGRRNEAAAGTPDEHDNAENQNEKIQFSCLPCQLRNRAGGICRCTWQGSSIMAVGSGIVIYGYLR
jgi:hypothetical protein